jgi:uncharacterized protein YbjT (DUF2867 family)
MIVVTGATGTIGSAVLRRLSTAGIDTRAFSRDPSRGPSLPHVGWAQADLAEEPDALRPRFEGADRLFLLTGNARNMTQLQTNAVEAAAAAGVDHVVKLSARGAQPGSASAIGRRHHEVEVCLKQTNMAWTMLRPHVFMQNLLDQAGRIRSRGEVRAASGDGRIPFIDTRDIADVAATVLTEDGHTGRTYVLTGGVALDYHQVAAAIGAATGRTVEYVAEDPEAARARLTAEGVPDWLVESRMALSAYHRAGGETARVTGDVFEITGHPPRSIAQFAYDHRSAFAPPEDEAATAGRNAPAAMA